MAPPFSKPEVESIILAMLIKHWFGFQGSYQSANAWTIYSRYHSIRFNIPRQAHSMETFVTALMNSERKRQDYIDPHRISEDLMEHARRIFWGYKIRHNGAMSPNRVALRPYTMRNNRIFMEGDEPGNFDVQEVAMVARHVGTRKYY